MVQYAAGILKSRKAMSIWGLRELRGIEIGAAEIRIGAACTYTDIRRHKTIAEEFPLLVRSAAWTGGIANQNRGTLGGNIANASPAGDSLPVLLAYDAELVLVSARGERRVPYRQFHLGYKKSVLSSDAADPCCLPSTSIYGLRWLRQKGRVAERPGHLEGVSRGGGAGSGRKDRGCPAGGGKRGADAGALDADRASAFESAGGRSLD